MNAEAVRNVGAEHTLVLKGRGTLEITGVTEVVSFDEQSVVLETRCGGLEIVGNALHIRDLNLDRGAVALDGRVDQILYDEPTVEKDGKKGFFGRLLH